MTLTIFTFGYWGWGNATSELVRAVDSVEKKRGFQPPLFVDIRISRSVRAVGFRDDAFETLLGPDRYVWKKELGNRTVETGKSGIEIAHPEAAVRLLDLALKNKRRGRRILFFCSCEKPGSERHRDNCHRVTVASLLLETARKRGAAIEIVEWPGGDLGKEIKRRLTAVDVRKLRRGGMSIPLGGRLPSAELLGLPWGSVCQIGSGDDLFPAIVGPARFQSGSWYLPLPYEAADIYADIELGRLNAAWWRKRYGFDARKTDT